MKKNYYAKALALTVAASMVSVPAFAAEENDTATLQADAEKGIATLPLLDEEKPVVVAEEETQEETAQIKRKGSAEEEQVIVTYSDENEEGKDATVAVGTVVASGNCGAEDAKESVQWELKKNGESTYTLTISGNGAMADFDPYYTTPWVNALAKEDIDKENYVKLINEVLPSITEVQINGKLTHIGENAFRLMGMTKIEIPTSVESMGVNALAGCRSLEEISLSGKTTEDDNFYTEDGVLYERTEEGDILYFYPAAKTEDTFAIPKGIVGIAEGSMSYAQFSDLEIPETVTSIGNYALSNSQNLRQITIPETVTSVGEGVLKAGEKLESVSFLANVTAIPKDFLRNSKNVKTFEIPDSIVTIQDYAFSGSGLTTVTVPEDSALKTIGANAFRECADLQSADLRGEKLTTIEKVAFYGCSELKSVSFPSNLRTMGEQVFGNCALEDVDISVNGDIALTNTFENSSPKKISIGSKKGTVSIADNFLGATSIEKVRLFGKFELGASLFEKDKTCTQFDLSGVTNIAKKEGVDVSFYYWRVSKTPIIYVSNVEVQNLVGEGGNKNAMIFARVNGGTFTEDTVFESGKLAKPTKEGYTFDGWYDNAGCTGNAVESPKASKTYYAKWVSEISLDANGGTVSDDTVKVVEGAAVGKLPTPTKEGYTFGGWYTAKGNGAEVTAETVPTGNATYYARWTKEIGDGEDKVTYYVNPIVGDVTYTGAELKPAIEVYKNGTKIEDTTEYTVEYTNNTNVGIATATVKVGDIEIGTANFNIVKATPTITISPSVTTQRGAGTVTLTVTKPETAIGAVTVKCDNDIDVDVKDGVYTAALPNATRTYTFTASYAGDDNYNEAEDATCTVDVTRKKSSSSSDTSAPTYGVSTGKTENGEISVTPAKAEAGETVTIKATPDSGYQLDKVTVKDKNNSTVKLTKVDDNEYTFTMPSGKVSVDATFVQKDAADNTTAAETGKTIKLQIGSRIVNVDNEAVIYDVAPVIRNDRTLVSIRIITETLGGKVDWNGATKEVTLTLDGKEIKMTIGKTLEKYGVAPVIIDGRTFVPVRFVADELGATVAWDDATKTVTIKTAR